MALSGAPAYLSGWGSYHPAGRLTNADLVERLDTDHAWLEDRIGINERRVVVDGRDTVASMGAEAVRRAAHRAGCDLADIDTLICGTSFDEMDMPAAAARIAADLHCDAFTFDVRAACSGWLIGVEVARTFLSSGRARRVAVCASERTTLGVDPHDRSTVVFFGDAAAAAIVQDQQPAAGLELADIAWRSDNEEHSTVVLPRDGFFWMDSRRTRAWVEKAIVELAGEVMGRNGLVGSDLAGVVFHQANLRLLEWAADRLYVPPDRHWHNVEWAGNTSAAGAPSVLAEALDRHSHELRPGDLVLVATVGSGLNVVAALFRWMSG